MPKAAGPCCVRGTRKGACSTLGAAAAYSCDSQLLHILRLFPASVQCVTHLLHPFFRLKVSTLTLGDPLLSHPACRKSEQRRAKSYLGAWGGKYFQCVPISISRDYPDFQLKSPLSHAPLPPLTRKLVSVWSVVLGASWPLQGNDRNALQAVHFKGFHMQVRVKKGLPNETNG